MRKILIIEDESFKARRIVSFLGTLNLNAELTVERSVTSGLSALFGDSFSVVLLDMSLSTFDVDAREGGGRPQNFGAVAVMEHMLRRDLNTPVIVITQFESFKRDGKEVGLKYINEELRQRFPNLFRTLIYYNSRETGWETQLARSLVEIGIKE